MTIESRDSVGGIVRATQLNNKKIYVLQIGASSFYKRRNFVLLQITANVVPDWGSFIITNWGSYYKLGHPLLQNRIAITNLSKIC